MERLIRFLLVLCMSFSLACGDGEKPNTNGYNSGHFEGEDTAHSGDSSETSMADDSSCADSDDATMMGILLDVYGVTDVGDGGSQGCRKIDFLFVFDNSGSMLEEQAAMVASVPGFAQEIQELIGLQDEPDYRILVATTDGLQNICQTQCPWGACNAISNAPGVNTDICADPESCDRTMGAGVLNPILFGDPDDLNTAQLNQCVLAGGNRYIDSTYNPDIAAELGCIGIVGANGYGYERPLDAAAAAISPQLNGVGGCNEGFLRPDALLVVVFVTDEDQYIDPNFIESLTPPEFIQAILAAKQNKPENVVMVAILDTFDNQLQLNIENPECDPEKAVGGVIIIDAIQPFPKFCGSSDAENIDETLGDAGIIIAEACFGFTPLG